MLGLGISLTSGSSLGEDFGTNHSILFDGSNDEINFTTSGFQSALADNSFKASGSVSIWARFESTSSNGQLWDFCIDTNNRIQLQYKHSDDKLTFTFKGASVSKLTNYDPSSGLENDGKFHHVVCTWDASSAKLYVDGSLRDTVDIEGVALDGDFDDAAGATGVEVIQGTSFNGNADFNGYLDDFAVYSDVLSASNVTTLYNSGKSDQTNVDTVGTIIAHWTFNEGTGTTVTDRINSYVGTFGSGGNAPAFNTTNAG
jgi:hypothetical protein|tara:strand:- start:43 stop:813 length:771 start_codon:yes stop_codon:yes gene_type:complete